MALLDMLKTKVSRLEDWSPDVPRSRIDMDALLTDMRRSGVAALDAFLAGCLDGERVPFIIDYAEPRRIGGALPEADGLRLLARATQTTAIVNHFHLTSSGTIE